MGYSLQKSASTQPRTNRLKYGRGVRRTYRPPFLCEGRRCDWKARALQREIFIIRTTPFFTHTLLPETEFAAPSARKDQHSGSCWWGRERHHAQVRATVRREPSGCFYQNLRSRFRKQKVTVTVSFFEKAACLLFWRVLGSSKLTFIEKHFRSPSVQIIRVLCKYCIL